MVIFDEVERHHIRLVAEVQESDEESGEYAETATERNVTIRKIGNSHDSSAEHYKLRLTDQPRRRRSRPMSTHLKKDEL